MTRTHRMLAGCLAAACVLLGTVAHATVYTTAGAPASSLTLEIWLGPPGGFIQEPDPEGDPPEGIPSILASTIGPLATNGTALATVNLDVNGDGTLAFGGASLILDTSNNNFVDLDGLPGFPLGTTMADLVAVGLSITSSDIPVLGNVWDLDGIGAPATFDLALDSGTISLHDHTGLLATLLDEPNIIDLATDPVSVGVAELAGFGIGGTADMLTIGVNIPAIQLDLGAGALGIEGLLFVRLFGDVNLVPVPEPGSVALLGAGLFGLVAVGIRRRRKV